MQFQTRNSLTENGTSWSLVALITENFRGLSFPRTRVLITALPVIQAFLIFSPRFPLDATRYRGLSIDRVPKTLMYQTFDHSLLLDGFGSIIAPDFALVVFWEALWGR